MLYHSRFSTALAESFGVSAQIGSGVVRGGPASFAIVCLLCCIIILVIIIITIIVITIIIITIILFFFVVAGSFVCRVGVVRLGLVWFSFPVYWLSAV